MKQKDSVNVIIPVYNAEKFIGETINSVLVQTLPPNRLIIVDDGSTDNSANIIKKFKSKKTKIIYKYQKNSGVSAARNTGLKLTKSKYVAFLDADDVWEKNKLEKQLEVFNNSEILNLGVVYCGCNHINEYGDNISFPVVDLKLSARGNIHEELLNSNIVSGSASSVLVLSNVFDLVGDFDVKIGPVADWDMWLRISEKFNFDYVKQKLVKIRHPFISMSSSPSKMLPSVIKFCEKHLENGQITKIPLDAKYYYFYSLFDNYNYDLPKNFKHYLKKNYLGSINTILGAGWDCLIRDKNANKKIRYVLGKVVEKYYSFIYSLYKGNIRKYGPNKKVTIISLVFNDPEATIKQLELLKINFNQEFDFIIADNSITNINRKKIKKVASQNGLYYIPIPLIFGPKLNPSFRHGLALNWLVDNFVSKLNLEIVGFLENDVFLIKPLDIKTKLRRMPFYGPLTTNNNACYLLPHCMFFNFNKLNCKDLNFLPSLGLDTGGRNHDTLYKFYCNSNLLHYYPKNISLPMKVELPLWIKEKISEHTQYFDGWVHLRSGSGWRKEKKWL